MYSNNTTERQHNRKATQLARNSHLKLPQVVYTCTSNKCVYIYIYIYIYICSCDQRHSLNSAFQMLYSLSLPPAPCRVRKWPLSSRSWHQGQSSLTQWERRCSREPSRHLSSGPSLMEEAKNWSHCLENWSTSLMWMGEIEEPLKSNPTLSEFCSL